MECSQQLDKKKAPKSFRVGPRVWWEAVSIPRDAERASFESIGQGLRGPKNADVLISVNVLVCSVVCVEVMPTEGAPIMLHFIEG